MSYFDFKINNENPLNKIPNFYKYKLAKSLSIDNIRTHQKKIKINSPASLHAMRQLGYSVSDLEYIPFNDYIRNNPNLINQTKKSQEKMYTKIEKIRNARFQKLKDLRYKLKSLYSNYSNDINNSSNYSLIKNTPKKLNSSMNNSVDILYSNANHLDPLDKGKQILDRVLYKNKTEFYNKIQFELNKEFLRKINEDKIKKQKIKYENYKLELSNKKKEEEALKIQRELELEEKKRQHELMIKQYNKEKYNEEIQKAKEEEKLQKQKRKEAELKWKEEQHRKNLFHKKLQERLEDKQLKILIKAKYLELRDSNKRKHLELKNKTQQEINHQKSLENQEHIEQTLKNNEIIKEELKKHFQLKEKEHEELEKRLRTKNQLESEKKLADSKKRQEEIQLILERNKAIQQQKINNYYEKQKNLEIKRENLEKKKEQENLMKKIEKMGNEEKIKNVLEKNKQILTQRKNKIINNIKTRDYLAEIRWKKKQENNEKKEEMNLERQIVKEYQLKELAQQNLNTINNAKMKILKREQKVMDFLERKSIINEQKKIITDEIDRKKKLYSDKLKKLLDNNSINKNVFNQIKNTFSGNHQISNVINKFDKLIENQ